MSITMKMLSTAIVTNMPFCPPPCPIASTACVMPKPKMKRIFASKICRRELTPERIAMVRNHPAPRRIRRMTGTRGSDAAGGGNAPEAEPPGLSGMFFSFEGGRSLQAILPRKWDPRFNQQGCCAQGSKLLWPANSPAEPRLGCGVNRPWSAYRPTTGSVIPRENLTEGS